MHPWPLVSRPSNDINPCEKPPARVRNQKASTISLGQTPPQQGSALPARLGTGSNVGLLLGLHRLHGLHGLHGLHRLHRLHGLHGDHCDQR